ncbi:hypothetical protein GALMADRAFT_141569 [Galerina marginata CBS 339.88]|uniref:Uncharacterized protein n=1 Tax=Galerina marginata (strain CBS 339.88) TaxID=685588 RepID=A0A067SWX4_GALM3|nr:hypothetical protein GALMADRAFT_141569 [Galerina marginata CBS 339.88]
MVDWWKDSKWHSMSFKMVVGRTGEGRKVLKARDEEEEVAWFSLTAFDICLKDSGDASHSAVTLSDDDFADLIMMSEDSDDDHEMIGEDETSDEESGSKNLEDSKDDMKATSHFIPGDEAYTTTFNSAAPNTILSDSGAPMLYL